MSAWERSTSAAYDLKDRARGAFSNESENKTTNNSQDKTSNNSNNSVDEKHNTPPKENLTGKNPSSGNNYSTEVKGNQAVFERIKSAIMHPTPAGLATAAKFAVTTLIDGTALNPTSLGIRCKFMNCFIFFF